MNQIYVPPLTALNIQTAPLLRPRFQLAILALLIGLGFSQSAQAQPQPCVVGTGSGSVECGTATSANGALSYAAGVKSSTGVTPLNLQLGIGSVATGVYSIAEGNDAVAMGNGVRVAGNFSTATGSHSTIANPAVLTKPDSLQGGFSTSYGTFNQNLTSDPARLHSGLTNVITGASNKVDNSNGAIVMGAGNTITNSYVELTIADTQVATTAAQILLQKELALAAAISGGNAALIAAAEAEVQTAKIALQTALTDLTTKAELGSTGIIGGANTANETRRSMVTGIRNQYSYGDKSLIQGYDNVVSGTAGKIAESNFVSGTSNRLTNMGNDNVVMGGRNTISGLNKSQLIGSDLTIAPNMRYGVAVGDNARLSGNGDVALGQAAQVLPAASAGSVALGQGSIAGAAHTGYYTLDGARDGQVSGRRGAGTQVLSVGAPGAERQIQNVAPGVVGPDSTDAINGSQLYQVAQQLGNVQQNVAKVDADARAGTASAMATAGLPQAYTPGKNMVAMGGSVYRGATAVAAGVSSISDNGKWILKGTVSGNSRGHFGGTVGVGYQW